MKVIVTLLALCVYANVCGAARPLRDVPARRSALRGLSQYFVDDQRLTGTNIFANQHFSRMRLPSARDLISNNAQIEASTPDGDKSYLIDSQATQVIKRQDYDATKDLLNQQVESATRNAPDKGDASYPNTVAGSTTSITTTAVARSR
ncbi:hypothetical protein MNEG_15543 [Monoraphidium neglectum]|uniref:Flagellar associated protein n=1 Tax=Monoraphidium neglectum TaxID=145388 RepID=A0A0D2MAP7_9CHLO|nr:hypothetical protein MNEG_15543 [Monoraphidium neglectum]KIY92420.1 hypothetical protein MNEG_15543 [Monoraphidium neglectum]|eukprot:XP_013891440.1 hypothetical protein MNEG_15543 [Monoraphidium neglectum]